jgi:glycosyltransferase involved in cell wall biosynthesis
LQKNGNKVHQNGKKISHAGLSRYPGREHFYGAKEDRLTLAAMVIVVNTFGGQLSDEGISFISKVLGLWAEGYSDHRFYIIYNDPRVVQGLPESVGRLFLDPRGLLPVRYRLSRMVKKVNAGRLLSLGGSCLPRTSIAQTLIVEPPFFTVGGKGGWLHRRRFGRCLQQARTVVTFSDFRKKELSASFPLAPGKIKLVPKAPQEGYRPLEWGQSAAVKETCTGGSEYFLYSGSLHPQKHLVPLLKAFSLFKKRQKTSMKLLLAGTAGPHSAAVTGLLQTYKYRDEVVLREEAGGPEPAGLLGAAYAFLSLSPEGSGALEAVRCGVPVLLPAGAVVREWLQEAGLYFDPAGTTDIADKMMQVYRDETLRDRMIATGKEKAGGFSWERTAALLWEAVN